MINTICLFFSSLPRLGIELRGLHRLGTYFATKLHPQAISYTSLKSCLISWFLCMCREK